MFECDSMVDTNCTLHVYIVASLSKMTLMQKDNLLCSQAKGCWQKRNGNDKG